MKRIKSIDGIVVNSNDDEMLDFAKALGCETIKRDPYYATDEISPNELYFNLAQISSFEKSLQEFKKMVDSGVVKPRGYNIRTADHCIMSIQFNK